MWDMCVFCCAGVCGYLVQGIGGWYYICLCCESGLFVEMASPGICIVFGG